MSELGMSDYSSYFCDGQIAEIVHNDKVVDYEFTGYIRNITNWQSTICYVSLWDAHKHFDKKNAKGVIYIGKISNVTQHGVNYAIGRLKEIQQVINIASLTQTLKNSDGDFCTVTNGVYHSVNNEPAIHCGNGKKYYYNDGVKVLVTTNKQIAHKPIVPIANYVIPSSLDPEYIAPKTPSFAQVAKKANFCKIVGCKCKNTLICIREPRSPKPLA